MSEIISLEETIELCLKDKEFIRQYEKLTEGLGANFIVFSPMERMINKATGYDEKQTKKLFDFIRDYIWIPSQLPLILTAGEM
jgi:hypothetical protein